MKITPEIPLNSICIHPTKGAGILRVNNSMRIMDGQKDCLPGWPTRLIQIEYPNSRQWQHVSEREEFSDIVNSNAPDISVA